MRFRTLAASGIVAAALALAGCTGGAPDPTPTPTGFASEAEAFAAAEATYRAYVDALNAVDLSDPATFEPVYALTTGEANAAIRQSLSQMHADVWQVTGRSVPRLVLPHRVPASVPSTGTLDVCVDVSNVRVTSPDGTSQVSPDRNNVSALTVTLESLPTGELSWIITAFDGREGEPLCVD